MSELLLNRLEDRDSLPEAFEMPQPRAVGSPLPRGNGVRVSLPPNYDDLERPSTPAAPGPVLAPAPASMLASSPLPMPRPRVVAPSQDDTEAVPEPVSVPRPALASPQSQSGVETPGTASKSAPPRAAAVPATGFQRAIRTVRAALPVVQKLLPLIDRNFATTVSNFLAPPVPPQPPVPQAAAPAAPVKVDLEPIQKSVAELQALHRDLSNRISDQVNSLKRVEDQLDMVREATDRNTLEQQELVEDLKSLGGRVNLVAAIAIGLLAISVLVNVVLYMHIQKVLP